MSVLDLLEIQDCCNLLREREPAADAADDDGL